MDNILNFTFDELENYFLNLNLERYRARQVFNFLYAKDIDSFLNINVLKKSDRLLLQEHFYIPSLTCKQIKDADGAIKFLFQLEDSNAIESVLIPMGENKNTICVSTQVGCRMNCKFCATAKLGLIRNLQAWEIVYQVKYIYDQIKKSVKATPNIVFMGMGEPLDNYENTVKAIKILNNEFGLSISRRRITVSTCGLVPGINKLKADLPYINLAISLNAANNLKRSHLMPINNTYNIEQLLKSIKDFPLPQRKRLTFEYVMIKGFNDKEEDIKNLTDLLKPLKCKLNLIPFNRHSFNQEMLPTENLNIESFAQKLRDKNIFVTLRKSKGESINAACGMLVATMR